MVLKNWFGSTDADRLDKGINWLRALCASVASAFIDMLIELKRMQKTSTKAPTGKTIS